VEAQTSSRNRREEARVRRMAAIAACVIGIGLVIAPFAFRLFERGDAGERVVNRFEQTMSTAGLAALQTNFKAIGDFEQQLTDRAFPLFASQLGMSQGEFSSYVRDRFPAIQAGIEQIPPTAAFVGPVIPEIVADQDEFEAVASLPFLGLPISSFAWLLLGLGVLLVVLGVAALRSAGGVALGALAVVGLGMLVVPFIFSIPSKASDAAKLRDLGDVALSQKAADAAAAANDVINGTVEQTGGELLPAIASRLGTSQAAVDALVEQHAPAVETGIKAWPTIRPGAQQLASIQAASVADNADFGGLPLKLLPWLVIVPGAILLVLAAAALRQARRDPEPAGEPDSAG
jgi:disulfide bond formation protein DsbB